MAGKNDESVRLDKWLWAARFYKTRAIAKEAIGGGKVQHNRKRAKPSREVRIGDHLIISREQERFEVTVAGLSARRGPASVAATLYEESEASLARRLELAEQRALQRRAAPVPPARRPDKRSRRRIIRFTRKGGD